MKGCVCVYIKEGDRSCSTFPSWSTVFASVRREEGDLAIATWTDLLSQDHPFIYIFSYIPSCHQCGLQDRIIQAE